MAFIIRGGYDIFRMQVSNVILKRTAVWNHGIIFGPKNLVLSELHPYNENHLELVKYNDESHILLLNHNIIYEHRKLFNYKIDLKCPIKPDLNDKNVYNFVKLQYVNYADIRQVNTRHVSQ
jgi:hypothetical protein